MRQALEVVGVRVGEDDGVEPAYPQAREVTGHGARLGAAVDKHRRGAGRSGCFYEQGVALPDVQRREHQPVHRGPRTEAWQHGQPQDEHEAERQAPARKAQGHTRTRACGRDQRDERDAGRGVRADGGPVGEPCRDGEDGGERGRGDERDEPAGGGGDLGDQRNDDADGRRERRRWHGDDVGQQRQHGDGAVGSEQRRSDGGLRTDRRPDERAGCAWTGQRAGDRRCEDEHAGGRQHGQDEPELAGQQRVDQQQEQDGDSEGVARIRPAPRQPGGQHQGCHHPGAQHGRFRADQHDEPGENDEADPTARVRADAEHCGGAENPGQHERDVGSRDGHQVGQAGRDELLGHVRGLTACVTGHEPGQQRRRVRSEPRPRGCPHAFTHCRGRRVEDVRGCEALERGGGRQEHRHVQAPQVRAEAVRLERLCGHRQAHPRPERRDRLSGEAQCGAGTHRVAFQ